MGVSAGYAQSADGSSSGYNYAAGSTTNIYAASKGGNDPWGTLNSGVVDWTSNWENKTITDIQAKNVQINVAFGKMIQFNNVHSTMTLTDSFLNFADSSTKSDHALMVANGSGQLTATFNGGSGSKTIDSITYNNVALYGALVFSSTNNGNNNVDFNNGATLVGMIQTKTSGAYSNATIDFVGGGNLIATDQDQIIDYAKETNIANQAIRMDNAAAVTPVTNSSLNINFGTANKVEVVTTTGKDSILNDDGTVKAKITSTSDGGITSIASANADQTIITNIVKGSIYVAGFGEQKSTLNLHFYNNGIIDGDISFSSNADMNLYFAHEGIIRSNLVFSTGADGSSGNGLVIKKTEGNNVVDKLTFDGSIQTFTAFSATAKDLIFIGNNGNEGKTIEIKNTGASAKGSIVLTSQENANFQINRISNGYKATFNLTAINSNQIYFHTTGNVDTSLGDAITTFNLTSTGQVTDPIKYDIDFLSGNITNPGTTNFNLEANNATLTQKVKFQTGSISNSGTFSLALTTKNAASTATFTTGNISNSGSMNLDFSNTTTPLTFTAETISNSKTLEFTPTNNSVINFKARGIYTTGNYSTTANTTINLGTQADFSSGYIASYSDGATSGKLTTTLNATIGSNQNFILSAIDLSNNSSSLTMLGLSENNGIANGSGKYVIFTGKSNIKTEVNVNFDNGNNSNTLVLGDIYTYVGTSVLTLRDTANTDTRADFIGNIQSRGTTNMYFENTLWAPTNLTEIIASMLPYTLSTNQNNVIKYIQTYGTGKVSTNGGTANIAVNNTDISFGNTPAIYQVDSSAGGNINIAIKGATNIGAKIKYNTNTDQASNLIFAATTNNSFSSSGTTNASTNQFFGVTYKDGVKLTLQDYQVNNLDGSKISFLQKARNALGIDSSLNDMSFITNRTSASIAGGTAYTDTILLSGVTIGTIQPLERSAAVSGDTYTYNVTLTKGSIFAGNINIHGNQKTIDITMEQGSKIFAHNNRLVLNKLVLTNETQHDSTTLLQNSFAQQNTTIDLATDGNDFANLVSRNTFNLLAIGNESDTSNTAGLHGSNALFRVYINPTATAGQLGSQDASKTGKTGADRVVILSGGSGKHYIQAIYDANANISNIAYYGGGTEVDGNIAVATVKTATDITMEGAKQIQGFDLIETAIRGVSTGVDGMSTSGKDYTTYFLESVVSTGASPINADTTTSAMGLNYDLFLANFNSLNKRMGELRNNDNAQGAWGRIFNGMLTTSYGLETQSIYTTIQAGYDYAFGFEGANNYLGVALSYANSISDSKKMLDYDGVQKGIDNAITHGVEVALYNSYVEDSGWFNDTIFKFSYMMSNLDITGQTTSYDTNNFGIVLSDEFGYRFKLGNDQEWYIDPQVEFGFGYFNQSDLKQVLGEASLDGIQDAIMTLRARVGANWAYDFKKFTQGKGINASVYLGTYYSYDYINGGNISLTTNLGKSTNLTPLQSTGRFELNVGTNIQVHNNTRIYFDFERSFGGDITTEYQVNLGVRYSFGENTGYTPVDPNKKSITPLKVSDEQKEEVENTQESVENKDTQNSQEQTIQ